VYSASQGLGLTTKFRIIQVIVYSCVSLAMQEKGNRLLNRVHGLWRVVKPYLTYNNATVVNGSHFFNHYFQEMPFDAFLPHLYCSSRASYIYSSKTIKLCSESKA
jgi:hypothetical protein